jgi:hypothetical protein
VKRGQGLVQTLALARASDHPARGQIGALGLGGLEDQPARRREIEMADQIPGAREPVRGTARGEPQ